MLYHQKSERFAGLRQFWWNFQQKHFRMIKNQNWVCHFDFPDFFHIDNIRLDCIVLCYIINQKSFSKVISVFPNKNISEYLIPQNILRFKVFILIWDENKFWNIRISCRMEVLFSYQLSAEALDTLKILETKCCVHSYDQSHKIWWNSPFIQLLQKSFSCCRFFFLSFETVTISLIIAKCSSQ